MTITGSTYQSLDAQWPREAVNVRTQARQLVLTSYERSSLTVEEYAAQVIKFAESPEERARKRGVQRRVDICMDAWGPLVRASLENWTTPEVFNAVLGVNHDHIDLSRNPAKHIWEELAVTYKYPPKRYTRKNEADGEKYLKLLEGTPFDLYWQQVELLLEACNEVLIWPDVIDRGQRGKIIKHRFAVGNVATLVTPEDDPTEIECVCISDCYRDLGGKEHKTWRIWTDSWYALFENDKDGKLVRAGFVPPVNGDVEPEDDYSATNPYGELPFYLIRKNNWPWGVWDSTSGEDLVDLTLRGGEERQFYRYHQKMSGFKQAAVTGLSIEDMPEQLLDPGFIAKFETDGQLTIIDWQLDLQARLDCMIADELMAAASRGINPERYKRTGNQQSAHGAQLSERGLEERRIRNTPIFLAAERAYKRLFCVVAEAHGLESPNKDIEIDVEFSPLAYPTDPAFQIYIEKQELSMGLESQVSLVRRRRPDWTDEQSIEYIRKNMEMIAEVNEMKASRNIPDDPTNESRSAEENGSMGPAERDKGKMARDDDSPPSDKTKVGKDFVNIPRK